MQFNYYLLSKSENRSCSISSLLFMACATPPFAETLLFFMCAVCSRALLFFTCLFLAFIFMFVFVLSAYDCVCTCACACACASVYVNEAPARHCGFARCTCLSFRLGMIPVGWGAALGCRCIWECVCVCWGCLRILTQQGKRRWTIAYIFCNLTSKLATAGCCCSLCVLLLLLFLFSVYMLIYMFFVRV